MKWFYKCGELSDGTFETVVDERLPGWKYTGLRVAEIHDSQIVLLEQLSVERILVPLSGSFTINYLSPQGPGSQKLNGRLSPFEGPTDILYLPIDTTAAISGSGRIAVAEGPAKSAKPVRYINSIEVPVELRGSGSSTRQVHNFGTPQSLDADRLIVCEVITPADNWSSYPPHKHDEYSPGVQSNLEEIYYFESASARESNAPATAAAMGYFRNYGTEERPIDTLAEVRTGDVALVPHGWHGPAMAAPGYDLYYLNVMAGPDPDRSWNIVDDPQHGWVRTSWLEQEPDNRLPYKPQE